MKVEFYKNRKRMSMKRFIVRNMLIISCSLFFWSWFWYFVNYHSISAVIGTYLIGVIGIVTAVTLNTSHID